MLPGHDPVRPLPGRCSFFEVVFGISFSVDVELTQYIYICIEYIIHIVYTCYILYLYIYVIIYDFG